jgi:opacity protein-like surface antigen/outer membrane protease
MWDASILRGMSVMAGRVRPFILFGIAMWLTAASAAAEGPARFDWRGSYVGLHAGGALGLVDVGDPYGASIYGDTVRAPGVLVGGQVGHNWQRGYLVYGLEADLSWADMDGTKTCFAVSGTFASSNCIGHVNWMGTFAGRLGWTLPFDRRTLIYGKAGLALAHAEIDALPAGGPGLPGTGSDTWHWGWMLGAGVERAILPNWTVKAEYAFLGFGNEGFSAPASLTGELLTPTPATATGFASDIHQFKIGMNYAFGDGRSAGREQARLLAREAGATNATQVTAGVRYVHGWGQFQKDLGIIGLGLASPASRLTYESSDMNGAEGFARVDTSFGLMLKGLVGGASGGGHMNDEDWGLPFAVFIPYSNTISSVDDRIRYWTVDVGYNWRRGASYTVTPFVGYSQLRQDMKGLGCTQIANPFSDCNPPIPTSVLAIKENDTWQSLRLGLAVDVALAPGLSLSGEAAYLPYVRFTGTDDHVLRSLLSPESGDGVGVQLEAMLSYAVTDALSVGVGGRYWSMRTTSGNVDFGGQEIVPMRYAAEQAHLLVQGSYKFNESRK